LIIEPAQVSVKLESVRDRVIRRSSLGVTMDKQHGTIDKRSWQPPRLESVEMGSTAQGLAGNGEPVNPAVFRAS